MLRRKSDGPFLHYHEFVLQPCIEGKAVSSYIMAVDENVRQGC
jgi:hypothetical protein